MPHPAFVQFSPKVPNLGEQVFVLLRLVASGLTQEGADSLIAELQAADTVIIALPMYNFSLPSMLKAWVDHIARAGTTFKYTDKGSVGLLQGKKVYLVAAMGGVHDSGVTDFLRPYMKHVLSFIGITDVETISAAGLNMGPEKREQGIAQARAEITKAVSQQGVRRAMTEGAA